VYSSRRHLPQRVRLLLDHLKRWAANPPEWAEPFRPQAVPVARRANARSPVKLSKR
jgi:hypothetical protein